MTLRARLVISLAAVLAVTMVVAGVLLVGLVRVGLVERVDRNLTTISSAALPMQRLMTMQQEDTSGGRSIVVIRFNRQGSITLTLPSGFVDSPDPLPALPNYTGGVPASDLGRVMELPSVDGSMRYRVLLVPGKAGAAIALAAPLVGVEAAMQTLVRFLLFIGIATIAVVLAVAWLIVRRGLLPVERVAAAADRIADGDLTHRAGVPHDTTEVGRLGAAFDGMLDQLQGAFYQQHEALAAKQESEGRLRRFVADASHELRTPVTAIRGYAELYRTGALADPAALENAMSRIEGESKRMGSLVDDLLLLARLDQGRPLRRDAVDLSRICADAVADFRAAAPSHPIAAAVDPGVSVVGDEDRLRQVVSNLLANVRVHTPPETPIELGLRTVADLDGAPWAELRVADHGPGIPPEHASRVFDRFYRADAARSRDTGGSGLGLSIVASIVAAQGGRLWHEATPGGGATFAALLPLTANSQPTPGQS
jgi:two-component system, OmpR family, sensor kinase